MEAVGTFGFMIFGFGFFIWSVGQVERDHRDSNLRERNDRREFGYPRPTKRNYFRKPKK